MHRADPRPLTKSPAPEQTALPFVLMRGGTSKAVFLRGADLPSDPGHRDRIILALFGSPDPRQVDGLGGADLLTSKLAIIDPPSRPDADLDYTFGQVSITEPVVDYDINCGNISAAVGAYGVDEGLVAPMEPVTTVRIHNTNTGRILLAEVPVIAGVAAVEGDLAIDGVPGTGAPIALDYSRTAGGTTGTLLPTGNPTDLLELPEGPVEISLVDLANLCVFFVADAVGMTGTEGPSEVTDEQMAAVVSIKEAAAKLLGMTLDGLVPIPVVVAPPAEYLSFATGEAVEAHAIDLVARVIGGRPPVVHKAYPGTVSACTAVAASIPGTTASRSAARRQDGELVIGHPSGTMPVRVRVRPEDGGWRVTRAAYARTARRLAEGRVFVRRNAWGSLRGIR
jgi:2-methylaconitate cis-trans-isomerase PrpF